MSARPTTLLRGFVAGVLPVLLLAGCGGPERGSLDTQPATPSPTCRAHQVREPAERYTAGREADTGAVLEMLRYYTANGRTPYCDGKQPTTADRAWQQLYTRLGGDPTHLAQP
ncbi:MULTISPECIES: hypothetical protein [Kitasatospora]|uniref:Lipoprotein n=1 Tax=Kitasatospora setae (strain ATCC 33774 / DSM 43861 / JCM 3304 / KCC A-0304 / NBRC 14216 / KM-6054) TaxID=452652 RepID=E4MZS0_KITSK|nr:MULTISPECIES: hypothetical protein [Kitasatospora]BAJ30004.1 hypothetical protein KSE_42190 [Kitasatospora setae KM-6054]